MSQDPFAKYAVPAPVADDPFAKYALPEAAEPKVTLDDAGERQFQDWYALAVKDATSKGVKLDPDPDNPLHQYDYRAAFKRGDWVDQSGHWKSNDKGPGHPNLVVGGFNTKTGKPEPGAKLETDVTKLIDMGWAPETAAQLVAQYVPDKVSGKSLSDLVTGAEPSKNPAWLTSKYWSDRMPQWVKDAAANADEALTMGANVATPSILQASGLPIPRGKPGEERTLAAKIIDAAVPTVTNIGGTIVGAALGGNPGAAAGSGLGNLMGQGYQLHRGLTDKVRVAPALAATATGGIPMFGKAAPSLARNVISRGAQGGLTGATTYGVQELAEGRDPTLGGAALATALGTTVGGGGAALESTALARIAAAREAAKKAAAAAPPTPVSRAEFFGSSEGAVGGGVSPIVMPEATAPMGAASGAPVAAGGRAAARTLTAPDGTVWEHVDGRYRKVETPAEPRAVEPTVAELSAIEPTEVAPSAVEPTEVAPSAIEQTEVAPSAVEPTGVPSIRDLQRQNRVSFSQAAAMHDALVKAAAVEAPAVAPPHVPGTARHRQLKALGYTNEQIAALTPELAKERIRTGTPPDDVVAALDAADQRAGRAPAAPAVPAPVAAAPRGKMTPMRAAEARGITREMQGELDKLGYWTAEDLTAEQARDIIAGGVRAPAPPPQVVARGGGNATAAAPTRRGVTLAPLPRDLAGAKPRYQQHELSFESDLDRAAYILAQKNPSPRDGDYLKYVMTQTGWDEATARGYGRAVREKLRDLASGHTGPGPIRMPASDIKNLEGGLGALNPFPALQRGWRRLQNLPAEAGGAERIEAGGPGVAAPEMAPGSTMRVTTDGVTWENVGGEWRPAAEAQAGSVPPGAPPLVPPRGPSGEGPLPAPGAPGRVPPPTSRNIRAARMEGVQIARQKPLDSARIRGEEKFLKTLPEPYRDGAQDILTSANHYEAQRRGVQPRERTAALSHYIEVENSKLIAKGTALNAEELDAYRNAVTSTMAKASDLAEKIRTGQGTLEDNVNLVKATTESMILVGNTMGARAETGRALNSLKKMSSIVRSKDGAAYEALIKEARRNGIDPFKLATKWAGITDPVEKMKFLQSMHKTTTMDWVKGIYFSNILSGIRTHLRNMAGNTSNFAFRALSQPAALGYDIARATLTGKERTIFAGEALARAKGALVGVNKGLSDARFSIENGFTRTDLGTFDLKRHELPGGGANPFNWTGRALEAEDQLFYAVNYNSELYARLYTQARQKKIPTNLIDETIAKWALNPPKDIDAAAVNAALHAVYKEKGGAFVEGLTHLKAKVPLLDFVLPFVRTPGNLLRQGIEGTIAAPLTKQFRANFAAGGRESAEAMGRMATGTAGLAGLAWWLGAGNLTGVGSSDPEEKAAATEQEGFKPNAIRLNLPGVGPTYITFSDVLQPLSQPLFAVANAWDRYNQGEKIDPLHVAMEAGESLLDQSFLSGVSDLNRALSDPDRYGQQFVQRWTQSMFVPFSGAARNLTQALDPVVREPQGILEGMGSIVPGVSQQLNPKIGRFGQEIEREGGPVTRGLAPYNVGFKSEDPVMLELSRLDIKNIAVPAKHLNETRQSPKIDLSVAERQQIGQATKAALVELFALPAYQSLSANEKKDEIRRAVQEARSEASELIRDAHERVSRR